MYHVWMINMGQRRLLHSKNLVYSGGGGGGGGAAQGVFLGVANCSDAMPAMKKLGVGGFGVHFFLLGQSCVKIYHIWGRGILEHERPLS